MKILLILLTCALASAADPAFTLVIDTTKTGATSSNQFFLPLNISMAYDFTVDWGDGGTPQVITTAANPTYADPTPSNCPTHTYSNPGVYTVKITENVVGGFPAIHFLRSGGEYMKVMELANWGSVTWTTLADAFGYCSNLRITATDAATARTGGVTDFTDAWFGCTSLDSFPVIDTSSATSLLGTWRACYGLTSFPVLDTSKVTNFQAAWLSCKNLVSFPSLNTSNGTNFIATWAFCQSLSNFPHIETGQATTFLRTWRGCTALTNFPKLNTGNASEFTGTWLDCTGLSTFPSLDLSRMTNGTDCFKNVTLSTISYSNLLLNLELRNTNDNVTFHGGNSTFDNATTGNARNALIANRAWSITDGGPQSGVNLQPVMGSQAGGTSVTITGTNLAGTSSVTFGGNPASNVVVVDANTVTCVTPTSEIGNLVDVRLTTATEAVTGLGAFRYLLTQTINFPPIGPSIGDSVPLAASATSGLPVTFSVVSGPALINGNTLSVSGPGTSIIASDQAGNSQYLAAPQVTQTITVSQPTVTILTTATAVTVSSTLTLDVVFSEAVTGFEVSDCSISNGTISTITGSGTTWTINLTAGTTVGGQLELTIKAAAVRNAWGITNTASNTLNLPIVAEPSSSSSNRCGFGGGLGILTYGICIAITSLWRRGRLS